MGSAIEETTDETTIEKEVLGWLEFGEAARHLARDVAHSDFNPEVVIAIARGGLLLAGAIAYALDIKSCGALNVEFYSGVNERLPAPSMRPPMLDEPSLAGKRVLLYETNANDRFGPYFDQPSVGTQIVQLAPNLSAINATPASALEEYGLMILRWKSVYEMVFENRVTRAFLRAIPGLDDYAMLGKVWYHTTEDKRGRPVWEINQWTERT